MRTSIKILMGLAFIMKGYALALPDRCHSIGIQSENLELKGKKGRLVFIHNISNTDIYLTRMSTPDPGAQAGWTSRINTNKWSVLKLENKGLAFQCVEVKPGHEQQVSCQNKLSVCQIAPKEKPANAKGNYWVSENQSLPDLLQAVSSRGFQLTATDDDNG